MPDEIHDHPLDAIPDNDLRSAEPILRHMIDHMAKRIEYAETRRSVLVAVGGAVMAASLALISVVVSHPIFQPLVVASLCFGVGGIFLGVMIWIMYSRQVNFRYPFTASAGTWKWFYRYAIPNYKEFKVPWTAYLSKELFEADRERFEQRLSHFMAEGAPRLFNVRDNTKQDLKQIFLLHVNEMYKNRFLTQLRSLVSWGLITNLVIAIIVFFVMLCE
jgi:hypothetical protein